MMYERGRIFRSRFNFAAVCNLPSKCITQVLSVEHFAEKPPHGPFDVLVPQTVDEGVQHGSEHSVHH